MLENKIQTGQNWSTKVLSHRWIKQMLHANSVQ